MADRIPIPHEVVEPLATLELTDVHRHYLEVALEAAYLEGWRDRLEECRRRGLHDLPASIHEALNSGDGTYRP